MTQRPAYYAQRGFEIIVSPYVSLIAKEIGLNGANLRYKLRSKTHFIHENWVIGRCNILDGSRSRKKRGKDEKA